MKGKNEFASNTKDSLSNNFKEKAKGVGSSVKNLLMGIPVVKGVGSASSGGDYD